MARLAEESGYTRFWLAEHHGMPSIGAPSEDEAEYLSRSMDLAWVQLRTGRFEPLPTPETVADRLRERARSAGAR